MVLGEEEKARVKVWGERFGVWVRFLGGGEEGVMRRGFLGREKLDADLLGRVFPRRRLELWRPTAPSSSTAVSEISDSHSHAMLRSFARPLAAPARRGPSPRPPRRATRF